MRKNNLTDDALRQAVTEMIDGLIDADLGGGARTIIATKFGERWFFLFAFAKNERANISQVELRALQELAVDFCAWMTKLWQRPFNHK